MATSFDKSRDRRETFVTPAEILVVNHRRQKIARNQQETK